MFSYYQFWCLSFCLLFSTDSLFAQQEIAGDKVQLDFRFINDPPGKMVSVQSHRLHVDCLGEGDVTILFEAGLGGSALEWQPVQRRLAQRATTCVYDRAGYAWSDRSPFPRHAHQLAVEADQLLNALQVDGPLVLVGHSFGGFVVRLLAQRRSSDVIGIVLVDSSHEDQLAKLEEAGGVPTMPTGRNFYVSSFEAPENLPQEIRLKVTAFAKTHKNRSSVRDEMALFRTSADQVRRNRSMVDYPVTVLTRGLNVYSDDPVGQKKNAVWQALQVDLVTISHRGSLTSAANSGHHVHVDEPELVASKLEELLDAYEKQKH